MTDALNLNDVNHMIVSLAREMTPQGGMWHKEADTLFVGGTLPTKVDEIGLANFGLAKNYKIVLPSFDPADVASGPIAFHAVITDGLTQSITLPNGRLWKRDRRSPAVLVFAEVRAIVRINSKGRLLVREMTGPHHDHGYELARDAVIARAGRKPGKVPVISAIGNLLTVVDIRTMAGLLAAAE